MIYNRAYAKEESILLSMDRQRDMHAIPAPSIVHVGQPQGHTSYPGCQLIEGPQTYYVTTDPGKSFFNVNDPSTASARNVTLNWNQLARSGAQDWFDSSG